MNQITLPEQVQSYLDVVASKYGITVRIEEKQNSKLMRLIGWFLKTARINKLFMENYYTTLGNTIYLPVGAAANHDPETLTRVIAHECIHILDSDRLTGPLFKFLYLFPQSLAVFSLLSVFAVWNIQFLWCLLFLLALAPIPAPFRYFFELRAYRIAVLFARKRDKLDDESMNGVYDWVIKQLSSSLYYFTWPFPNMILKHLKDERFMSEQDFKPVSVWIIKGNTERLMAAYKLRHAKEE